MIGHLRLHPGRDAGRIDHRLEQQIIDAVVRLERPLAWLRLHDREHGFLHALRAGRDLEPAVGVDGDRVTDALAIDAGRSWRCANRARSSNRHQRTLASPDKMTVAEAMA